MYKYKKIIVALDLTEMDNTILKYTQSMCEIIKPEKIYFLNIQRNLDVSEEMRTLIMGDDIQPMDEYVYEKMKTAIRDNFPEYSKYDYEYEVVEGKPSRELVRWVKMKDTDLLVMGRKRKLGGSGITPQEAATKVKCSSLMVPEDYHRFSLDHILVPVDFSDHAKSALQAAFAIDENHHERVKLSSVNVYELPLGHEKSGKTDEEFAEIMTNNAKKKFNVFINDLGDKFTHLTAKYLKIDSNETVASKINDYAHDINADMILIGAKSRTAATQFFTGSITSKLIQHDSDIPLLIVKDKNDTFDFWDFVDSL